MASLGASGLTGVTSFELMQQGERLTYFAFDLLELDGEDIARLPLVERKKQLAARWRPTRPGYGPGVDRDNEYALSSSWSRKPPPFWGRCRWRTNTSIPGPGPRGPFRLRRTRGRSSRGFAPMKRGEHLWFAGSQRHVVRTVGRSPAKPNSVCGQHVERRVDVGRRGRGGWWSSRSCGYRSPGCNSVCDRSGDQRANASLVA